MPGQLDENTATRSDFPGWGEATAPAKAPSS